MHRIEKSVKEVRGLRPDSIPPEILVSTEPLLLKGLVADWPIVQAGRASAGAVADYLLRFYKDAPVGFGTGSSEMAGRFFYDEDMTGFNFDRQAAQLDRVLEQIVGSEKIEGGPAYYVGSTNIDASLPGFRAENDIEFGDLEPLANFWLGNRSRIAAHWDLPNNVACCAAGRRTFTLFPPDQLANLYVGPLHFTPSGQQISLVDFHAPDFDRFPRFREALQHARLAELGPGDAVFVPSMWWHHVEALDDLNLLINYWWRTSPSYMGTPVNALNHALLTIRDLPPEQRDAWQGIFDHYVFAAKPENFEHIAEHARGPLGPIDVNTARMLRADLLNKLNR